MKKIVWMVGGVVVVIGVVLLVGRNSMQGSKEGTTEYSENTEIEAGGAPDSATVGSEREAGGAQASATKGREASAPPEKESHQSVKSVDDSSLSDPVKALLG
jgi:hypothetical protein